MSGSAFVLLVGIIALFAFFYYVLRRSTLWTCTPWFCAGLKKACASSPSAGMKYCMEHAVDKSQCAQYQTPNGFDCEQADADCAACK